MAYYKVNSDAQYVVLFRVTSPFTGDEIIPLDSYPISFFYIHTSPVHFLYPFIYNAFIRRRARRLVGTYDTPLSNDDDDDGPS